MSGENAFENDADGRMILKNQLTQDKIPQVNFSELFKVLPVPYGEAADLEVNKKPNLSVYINLGLFFLMLNHTGLLYNKETLGKIKTGDVVTPVTYLDFNPETNYYLSSINQMSLDPYKFLVPYIGKNKDYEKLFDSSLIPNGFIKAVLPKKSSEDQQVSTPAATKLFDFNDDRLSGALPEQKKPKSGGTPDGYIGRLMYIMVDINYLLEEVIQPIKTNSDNNEAYFQTVIEKILSDLNKSMGLYNSFRLSYSDTGNCYVITDDQIQMRPDETIQSVHSRIVKDSSNECEIPVYGKSSIARSFEIRTDLSSRLASMIAIASNPGVSDQVSNSKNTSDFGIYNTGSFDRYLPYKVSDPTAPETESSNAPAAQLAINFNNVVKSIYSVSRDTTNQETSGLFISRDSINKAMTYYIDRMAKVKNEQPESVHAMIIPLKSSITMDGMSGLYPFQLYTVDERILPYRYSSTNLSNGPENLRKIAFSISKMTHTISDNQWVTSMDGFMTTLRNPSKQGQSDVREVKPTTIPVTESDMFGIVNLGNLPKNANIIYNFFIRKNLSSHVAAAFVGNFWQESGLNPESSQDKSVTTITPNIGYGLAQWTIESRQNKLKSFALGQGKKVNDLYLQLDFVWEELNTDFLSVLIKLKTSKNVQEATSIIMNEYERPNLSKANFPNRLAAAEKIFKDNTATLS
jgi:hypothetical protein